jgi:hypothetical protein
MVQDTMFGFAGTFAGLHANVVWSGGNDATGFHFQANPGDFGTTVALGGTPSPRSVSNGTASFSSPAVLSGKRGMPPTPSSFTRYRVHLLLHCSRT